MGKTRGKFLKNIKWNLSRGGLKFFSLSRVGLSARWALNSIDFTGPGEGLSPHSPPPLNTPLKERWYRKVGEGKERLREGKGKKVSGWYRRGSKGSYWTERIGKDLNSWNYPHYHRLIETFFINNYSRIFFSILHYPHYQSNPPLRLSG